MTRLVDDQTLGRLLRADDQSTSQDIFTTGCWYVRLTHAVLGRSVRGKLSTPFEQLPIETQRQALRALITLPPWIDIVNWRDIGADIAQVRLDHRLNLLSAEVIAVARHTDATVELSSRAPRLEAALRAEGLGFISVQ